MERWVRAIARAPEGTVTLMREYFGVAPGSAFTRE